uniref:RRM domain-containing protein n=1 Tax=Acrobeloides nanus TaxID=290746 RepID=A0A914CF93_9BILA
MPADRKRNINEVNEHKPKGRRDDRDNRNGGGDRNRRDRDYQSRGQGSTFQGGPGGGPQGMPQRNDPLGGSAFTEAQLLRNLPLDMKEPALKELFSPHGDISECYLSGKGFAFLRMDTRAHAESAKEALDGHIVQGRAIRVRFAVHGAAIKIKELPPVVSNERLYHTFSAFGEVERAVHIVDEKGKPTGEGVIEFERKNSATEALNQIKDRVFLITANSRPLQAEILEPKDDEDGLAERMIPRSTQLFKERELGPRFASLNSFEFVYGRKWKELYEMEKRRREELEVEFKEARHRLEADMEIAYQDYQTQLLREELQRRQQELERLEAARGERMRMMGVERPFHGQNDMRGPMGGQVNFDLRGPPPGMDRGPPPGMDAMGRNGPPMGANLQQPPGGQITGEIPPGVRSILQMFKNDASSRPPPPHGSFFGGPPPQTGMGIFGVPGNRPHQPPNDFIPPEKRNRP